MSDIHLDSLLSKSNEQVSCDLDGETLILSIENGKYYHMNETSSRIWELLESPREMAALCDSLQEEYDVTPAKCQEQVLVILKEMLEAGLVTAQ